ncbi:serine hydrolase domain-containing protein [Virgisporangium aurantiacum]|uniref:Serine hydrolase n=1 Tax=Virgisporangium aurantiacum TaxID=175570 RepID=A0A8J3Z6H8_9ACTN|nr:serine hydrolase domain-containing protein [Virgisporangium aurantiacum]GIJ57842.1 serine hydrolase [Virgisporangium aurantiacum]
MLQATALLDGAGDPSVEGSVQPFPIYSVTKTVLAVQVLQLGLDLSTPVSRWLPRLPGAADITVAHLLGHTSGLPSYAPEYDVAVRAGEAPWPDESYVDLAARRGLLFRPGAGWNYSNVGYLALRRIVEAERGQPWAAAVRQTVLAPAGLAATFPLSTVDDLRRVAPSTSAYLGDAAVADAYHPGWVAHGLLAATAGDLARLLRACLATDTLLAAPAREAMTRLRPLDVPGRPLHPSPGYGLGVMGSRQTHVVGHTGEGPGYAAAAYLVPRYNRVVAVLVAVEDQSLAEEQILNLASTDARHPATRPPSPEIN